MEIIDKLEQWRQTSGKVTWSLCGPDKRFTGTRFQLTLYKYDSRRGRYVNEASMGGDSPEEAFDRALALWKKRSEE